MTSLLWGWILGVLLLFVLGEYFSAGVLSAAGLGVAGFVAVVTTAERRNEDG